MSEHKTWMQRHGAMMIAALMIGGLVVLMVLNAN
jgi:hypothetical protein